MGKILGNKLKQLRKDAKLTQEEAIAGINHLCRLDYENKGSLSRSALCNYEKGIRTPSGLMLVMIADFYEVDVKSLIICVAQDCAVKYLLEG